MWPHDRSLSRPSHSKYWAYQGNDDYQGRSRSPWTMPVFVICRISQNSASYFLGDPTKDSLQRLWGISFPETKQLTEYKEFLAEAAKRDHRKIGKVWAALSDRLIYDANAFILISSSTS